jgi:hypothetical protein
VGKCGWFGEVALIVMMLLAAVLAVAAGIAGTPATRPPATATGVIHRQILDMRSYFLPAGRAPSNQCRIKV